MDIQVFINERFGSIRASIASGGDIWFVAKDVCEALGVGKYRDSLTRLDDDERGSVLVDTPGGPQKVGTVNEAGFYKIVLRSRKPEAKAFQRWVTHEVLPAIRRTGGYIVAKQDETPDEIMARAVLVAQDTINRQKKQIEELKPKALFADAVAASDGTCLIGELAKMLRQNGISMGQNRLFAWMRDRGYLGKSGNNYNVPTQRAMEQGLFRIKETAVTHSDGHVTINRTPKVTGKGQRYFVEALVKQGEISA